MKRLASFADDRPLWEQQPRESAEAYAALRHYARLPYVNRKEDGSPGPRSLQDSANELGKAVQLLKRWSAAWRWVERCEAYDIEQRRVELEAYRAAERDLALRLAKRRVAFKDDAWAVYEVTMARVREMLAFPIYEETSETIEDGPGGPSLVIVRHPKKGWNHATAAGLLKAAVALGIVASTDESRKALEDILAQIDPESLTDEQLQALVSGEDPISVLLSRIGLPASSVGDAHETEA